MIGKSNISGSSGAKVYVDGTEVKAKEVDVTNEGYLGLKYGIISTTINARNGLSISIINNSEMYYCAYSNWDDSTPDGIPYSYDINSKTSTAISSSRFRFIVYYEGDVYMVNIDGDIYKNSTLLMSLNKRVWKADFQISDNRWYMIVQTNTYYEQCFGVGYVDVTTGTLVIQYNYNSYNTGSVGAYSSSMATSKEWCAFIYGNTSEAWSKIVRINKSSGTSSTLNISSSNSNSYSSMIFISNNSVVVQSNNYYGTVDISTMTSYTNITPVFTLSAGNGSQGAAATLMNRTSNFWLSTGLSGGALSSGVSLYDDKIYYFKPGGMSSSTDLLWISGNPFNVEIT